jgi:anaerobic magnesium-protoporphyrin IX monomethyl ester cyclase
MKVFFYQPTSSTAQPEPPVGVGCLIAVAQQMGCEVEFFDHDLHSRQASLERLLQEFRPDVFAVTCMTPQYYHAQNAVRMVHAQLPECRIIIGGAHPSALPIETMKELPELEFLAAGEGDRTFRLFLEMLKRGETAQEIPGLYRRRQGEIVVPSRVQLMTVEELDELPQTAWDVLLKRGLYEEQLNYTKGVVPVFAVITGRGCPFECTFCSEGLIWERRVRCRSVEKVVTEIRYLIDRYGAHHFNILDDTFVLKKERVRQFCELVKPLGIEYRITANANVVTQSMLDALAASGCRMVAYGVESGDENVLRRMKKRQTLDQVREAFRMTKQANMMAYALCMVGNLGEDFAAVQRTARFVSTIGADLFSASIMTPYPGSENYEICKKNGWIISTDWKMWCPSPIRLRNWEPVVRTDTMDGALMKRSYYYLNRAYMMTRFRRKYGRLFFLNPSFHRTEVLARLRVAGPMAILRHAVRLAGTLRRG